MHLTFFPRWLFTRTDVNAQSAITRALTLSLFCSFLFSTWIGISMNHLVGLLVHTRPKDGKIRCLPGPWFSTWEPRKDKLDFLIRRQQTIEVEFFALWNSRGKYYDYWSSDQRRLRVKKDWEKQNEVKVRWLYVEKKAYPQSSSLRKMRLITLDGRTMKNIQYSLYNRRGFNSVFEVIALTDEFTVKIISHSFRR